MASARLLLTVFICFAVVGFSAGAGEGPKRDKCAPRDDCSGHVTGCDDQGNKICKDGWTGKDCTEKASGDQQCCPSSGTDDQCDLFCTDGVCFDLMCCCPNDRIGNFCENGTGIVDPCDPDPCDGEFCQRAPPDSDYDFFCDDKPTEPTEPGPDNSVVATSGMALLVLLSGLLALIAS